MIDLVDSETKMAFRKPSNDAANRKYRRHSPVGGSSSSEGSQHHDRTSSPVLSKEDIARDSEHQSRRKDSGKETDGDDMKGYRGRNDGSYRNYEPKSSRTSHGYNRQDDRVKPEKHADDSNRNYDRFSSRSGRDMRVSNHSDYTRQESDQGRSRRYSLKEDRYSRDGYDASGHRNKDKDKESDKYKDRDSSFNRAGTVKRHTEEEMGKDWRRRDRDDRDERKSSEDHKSHRTESRGHRRDTSSARDNDKYRSKGEEKNWDELEACRDKDKKGGAPLEQIEKKSKFTSENEESPAKKPKRFSSADEKLVSEKVQEGGCSGTAVDVRSNVSEVTNDINAARIAAMKAAEQVNKNLVGVGFMTADQKKKLLWGNKKAAAPEETGNRWDAVTFGDRERQEKFNKLMGVKGELKVENKPDAQNGDGILLTEKQKELQLDLEKQYTAGLRRRDGRTVGLGL